MSGSRYSVAGSKRLGNPSEHAGQVQDAQENQHQPNGKLHRKTNARGNHPAKQNDSASNDKDRERMAETPKCTNQCGLTDLFGPRDNGRNGDHMVGVRGMPHSEKKSKRDDGDQANHICDTHSPWSILPDADP